MDLQLISFDHNLVHSAAILYHEEIMTLMSFLSFRQIIINFSWLYLYIIFSWMIIIALYLFFKTCTVAIPTISGVIFGGSEHSSAAFGSSDLWTGDISTDNIC